jgi:hypothetical protein
MYLIFDTPVAHAKGEKYKTRVKILSADSLQAEHSEEFCASSALDAVVGFPGYLIRVSRLFLASADQAYRLP